MYKPISDYGMIGDCRSCALISPDGSIDFCCLPDFDSSAQFLSLLDDKKGGFFKLSPKGVFKSHQKYLEDTNVLETSFFNHEGNVSLTDLMPKVTQGETQEFGTRIIRLIRAVKGDHIMILEIKITPDFAREKLKVVEQKDCVIFTDSKHQYVLRKKHHQVKISKGLVTVEVFLKEGTQEFFSLEVYRKGHSIPKYNREEINAHLADIYFQTIEFWTSWASLCTYRGEYREQILRSALTLKMLTYSPTGAIIAAPTTSLPEKIGGGLNWDYRYSWLRDSSFTIYAFLSLGYRDEALEFINWLEKVCLKESGIPKIMYGIRGEREPREQTLPHLKGYLSSKPVRVGNGAKDQKQFDIFGEVLSSIYLYVKVGGKVEPPIKDLIKKLVDYCCLHWSEKDTGIWEGRNGDKHNTYSKLMCWVGIDRGIRLSQKLKIKNTDYKHWNDTREQIKQDILKNGFNEKVNSFTAYYNSDVLDTSTLNIPLLGLLPANDKRVLSTLDNVMEKLVVDWFVLRTSDTENKLQEGEGTFFLSTFWLIDCLTLLGRVDEARVWLSKIIHDASPLGLYAEEFDPRTKRHLGNYPQAFTHLGLINSLLNLNKAQKQLKRNRIFYPFRKIKGIFPKLLSN